MQFFAPLLALSLVVVLTAAQNTTTAEVATTTYALSPEQSCLGTCKVTDVNCRAACVGASHPNQSQLSMANACSMKCVQGDGSVSQTNTYNQCLAACQSSYLPTTQAAVVTGASTSLVTNKASTTGNGTIASTTTTSGGSGSGTATGTAAVQTVSKAAAAIASPFIGGLGLVLAALAL